MVQALLLNTSRSCSRLSGAVCSDRLPGEGLDAGGQGEGCRREMPHGVLLQEQSHSPWHR